MLDLTQLRSFVAVEQMGSFTLAAERLGLGQSTVSQHIQRLESAVGRRLLARDTHKVAADRPTARRCSVMRGRCWRSRHRCNRCSGSSSLRGALRLGVSEDFVTSQLPAVLEDFVRSHPSVDLELTVALSGTLYEMQDSGEIDLVLAKRRLGDAHGRLVYREPLVWLARDPEHVLRGRPLPLIAFPPPSVTRSIALEALGRSQARLAHRLHLRQSERADGGGAGRHGRAGAAAQHGAFGVEGDRAGQAAGA